MDDLTLPQRETGFKLVIISGIGHSHSNKHGYVQQIHCYRSLKVIKLSRFNNPITIMVIIMILITTINIVIDNIIIIMSIISYNYCVKHFRIPDTLLLHQDLTAEIFAICHQSRGSKFGITQPNIRNCKCV